MFGLIYQRKTCKWAFLPSTKNKNGIFHSFFLLLFTEDPWRTVYCLTFINEKTEPKRLNVFSHITDDWNSKQEALTLKPVSFLWVMYCCLCHVSSILQSQHWLASPNLWNDIMLRKFMKLYFSLTIFLTVKWKS